MHTYLCEAESHRIPTAIDGRAQKDNKKVVLAKFNGLLLATVG